MLPHELYFCKYELGVTGLSILHPTYKGLRSVLQATKLQIPDFFYCVATKLNDEAIADNARVAGEYNEGKSES